MLRWININVARLGIDKDSTGMWLVDSGNTWERLGQTQQIGKNLKYNSFLGKKEVNNISNPYI